NLKKDLPAIRAMQKEIALQVDKTADAAGAVLAAEALKGQKSNIIVGDTYRGEETLRRKEYYLANPSKIPFYQKEMGETKRRDAYIKASKEADKLENELIAFVDGKMYALDEANLELAAKYWAGRVLNDKDTTFEELAVYSINWIGDSNLKNQLMMMIKYYVEQGSIAPLTQEEQQEYDKNKDAAWALLHAGFFDKELDASLSGEDCVNLLARHYAEYNAKNDWDWALIAGHLSSYQAGERILAESKEAVKNNEARRLSLEENERVNACVKKLRDNHPRSGVEI
ncbi:MAG: hypothetical protein LBR90_01610, partial [Elusimicrobiota bacterium]|nr:hypothetical protein [Elusimicrobiota bacterium]